MRQFRVDNRNRCRLTSAETNTHCSVGYGGAVRRKPVKTRADNSVVDARNELSQTVVDAVIVNSFKARLDKFYASKEF